MMSDDQRDERAALFRVMYTTRALRRLKPDTVPEELLFQLVDAAIRAPSGQNRQDWRFVVVTDPAIKGLMQQAATEAWSRYQPEFAEHPELIDELPRTKRLSLRSTEHLARHIGDAPAVVIVCGIRGRHSTPGGGTFPAVQNLLLAARALGLGASIFQLALSPAVLEAVGIPDDTRRTARSPSAIRWTARARCDGGACGRSRSAIDGASPGRSRRANPRMGGRTAGCS